jgi:hypothetical protein
MADQKGPNALPVALLERRVSVAKLAQKQLMLDHMARENSKRRVTHQVFLSLEVRPCLAFYAVKKSLKSSIVDGCRLCQQTF